MTREMTELLLTSRKEIDWLAAIIIMLFCLIAKKILICILLNRLSFLTKEILPKSQCYFTSFGGKREVFFVASQLQKKFHEQHKEFYMTLIDLSKAFDSINKEALWKILMKLGCLTKFGTIIRLLHGDMTATILSNGSEKDPFTIRTGVQQGCVIAPTFISSYITSILHLVTEGLPSGISIQDLMDKNLFKINWLHY